MSEDVQLCCEVLFLFKKSTVVDSVGTTGSLSGIWSMLIAWIRYYDLATISLPYAMGYGTLFTRQLPVESIMHPPRGILVVVFFIKPGYFYSINMNGNQEFTAPVSQAGQSHWYVCSC
jgi:hypothetical protein